MTALRDVLDQVGSLEEFSRAYPAYVEKIMERIDPAAIARLATLLDEADAAGGTVYFVGNGGSAATASHFENDMALGLRTPGRPGLRAATLMQSVSTLTAASNDDGYENALVAQLEPRLRPQDLLVVISVSGNSENLVRAVAYAGEVGATTAALLGFDGGKLLRSVDHAVHVPTDLGEYGPVEDAFSILDHMLTAYLARQRASVPATRVVTTPG